MFTSSERAALRSALLDRARADFRITGGAITGSASVDREDAWSDIDLAFGVRTGVTLEEVLGDFTAVMAQEHGAVDWFDVFSGAWTYRVFLLASTLQVDLAFAPEDQFGARAPTFSFSSESPPTCLHPRLQERRMPSAWLGCMGSMSAPAFNGDAYGRRSTSSARCGIRSSSWPAAD